MTIAAEFQLSDYFKPYHAFNVVFFCFSCTNWHRESGACMLVMYCTCDPSLCYPVVVYGFKICLFLAHMRYTICLMSNTNVAFYCIFQRHVI